MRIFEKPNLSGRWKCPICNSSDEKPVFLAGKYGTQKDNLVEAEQIHVECLDLWYYEDTKVLAMRFENDAT